MTYIWRFYVADRASHGMLCQLCRFLLWLSKTTNQFIVGKYRIIWRKIKTERSTLKFKYLLKKRVIQKYKKKNEIIKSTIKIFLFCNGHKWHRQSDVTVSRPYLFINDVNKWIFDNPLSEFLKSNCNYSQHVKGSLSHCFRTLMVTYLVSIDIMFYVGTCCLICQVYNESQQCLKFLSSTNRKWTAYNI